MSKPLSKVWTDEQWKAITEKGQNILVAAAAGSGKTAVLVERIVRTVLDEQEPCDVDRLLVVTFTKAAAAEMKDRIRSALAYHMEDADSVSDHLRRQLAFIHRAPITTIHSFCLEVIRQHVQQLDIDPAFRIANETEMEMIRQEVMEEMLEEYYASSEEGSDFWTLVDSYSGQRSDAEIAALIFRLYDFSRSLPFPELWLNQSVAAFMTQAGEHAYTRVWFNSLMQAMAMELNQALLLLQQALELALLPEGPAPYALNIQKEIAVLEELLQLAEQSQWEELYLQMQTFSFGRLKPCKKEEVNRDLQEHVKSLREEAKKQVQSLKEQLFTRSKEQYLSEIQMQAPLMKMLETLVRDFDQRLMKEKRARGLMDFTDLEHECLQLLLHPSSTPDQLLPSEVAVEYQHHFKEILVDEYQDTNRVQEAILTLISRNHPGNRFMVGDVKQSIYRFRQAEPGLFLEKYRCYQNNMPGSSSLEISASSWKTGLKIDLSKNFRSRKTIVDGVNDLFRKMMNEEAFEIEYDKAAELVYEADYPKTEQEAPIQMIFIDRSSQEKEEATVTTQGNNHDVTIMDAEELETVQLETRAIIMNIRQLLGLDGGAPAEVVDRAAGGLRPITYRDIVILLRATKEWAPVMMEELKAAGIPSYAELNTGYFQAGEVELMVSLLQVIDNPYQDIPLAAVLRSEIVGLNADELARLRFLDKKSFFEAVRKAISEKREIDENIQLKLTAFMNQLERWRTASRQSSLSDLIALIYKETGYFELVGAMPGGMQKQANLRALYDRAKQYESTSYRGLFRFLRFIDRLKENNEDLGTARALGEQEDVVRIMSIHKSKGLEFPVVFVCGLGKRFNRQDLNQAILMHRELGFGAKVVDLHSRVSYPSLPYTAIQKKLERELLAEEMRVLYVALTRAKEKLYLIGSSANLESQVKKWASLLPTKSGTSLPNVLLSNAQSMLDWIGPSLLLHSAGSVLKERYLLELPTANMQRIFDTNKEEEARFIIHTLTRDWDGFKLAAPAQEPPDPRIIDAIQNLRHIPTPVADDISARLDWTYPYKAAEGYLSKVSVSELKKYYQMDMEDTENAYGLDWLSASSQQRSMQGFRWRKELLQRPRFLSEKQLTPVERGMAYHTVMQLLPLERKLDQEALETMLEEMVRQAHLTQQQKEAIDPRLIINFFETPLGQSLLHAHWVQRELPFSFGLKAKEVFPDAKHTPDADEIILIQGVIDCIFETDEGIILLDYKTDAVYGDVLAKIKDRYELQISLYKRAVEQIWNQPVKNAYLFLFDGSHLIDMSSDE